MVVVVVVPGGREGHRGLQKQGHIKMFQKEEMVGQAI